jgi:serine/threonine protein kinase
MRAASHATFARRPAPPKPTKPLRCEKAAGRFSDFDLGRRLGGGSFGEVHAAYDRVQKAHVALKRLRHADALEPYRFKKEFRPLADIFHPISCGFTSELMRALAQPCVG